MMRNLTRITILASLFAMAGSVHAQKQTAAGVQFFERRIRPLLVQHCYKCHGPRKQSSGLRVDRYSGMIAGGDSGAALMPGKPAESLLYVAVSYRNPDLQMPPKKKLSKQQIALLRQWIQMGAPHPQKTAGSPKPRQVDIDAGRKFWSFRPVVRPTLPKVKNSAWVQSPIDAFILARLEQRGLSPAPAADRITLIRRATFDLTGLPPTPEQIREFLQDSSPTAFTKVIDRLLSSPTYGERWGRHWLDVARYADSNGLDENVAHGNAYRYRDYVVRSLNLDKPFNDFVREQVAGDLLPPSYYSTRRDRVIATGFLSLGPKVLAEPDKVKMEMDIIDEQIDSLGRSLLGLTFGCARCHDHKFDPILTADYYALAGIFKSTKTMDDFRTIAKWHENPVETDAQKTLRSAHEKKVAAQRTAIQSLIHRTSKEVFSKTPGATRPKDPKKLEAQFPAKVKQELASLRKMLAGLEKAMPAVPTAMGVMDQQQATDIKIHMRGSHLTLGALVKRRIPVVLQTGSKPSFTKKQSGRLQLANWLADDRNPLTSRVIVNRIWRWHFGVGIVSSPDNFGQLGERPTHPKLLNFLASWFIDQEWSFKRMHRMLMLSSTYQMSSRFDARSDKIDPNNQLLWRFRLRRLEAEAIRDAFLAVSGRLDRSMGGSMLHVKNRQFLFDHTSKDGTNYGSVRRSLYLPVIRNHLYDVFSLFDYSDASVLNGNRSTTTVAPQALFILNSQFVNECTESLATDLVKLPGVDRRVQRLYQLAYGRAATTNELSQCKRLLAQLQREIPGKNSSVRHWQVLSQVVLAANEFIYLR